MLHPAFPSDDILHIIVHFQNQEIGSGEMLLIKLWTLFITRFFWLLLLVVYSTMKFHHVYKFGLIPPQL